MQCSEARDLVSAYVDGELSGTTERNLAAHVASCPACSATAEDYRHIGRGLATLRLRGSDHLSDRIRARMDAEPALPSGTWHLDWRPWLRQAAVVLVTCGLSALLTWQLTLSSIDKAQLEREIVTAHVRSLMQDSTTQVASSDRHTVKPWFAGRLEFAPSVKDLTAEGYPLVGGRLDMIADRRVGVIVYKRRQHVINVFAWPSSGPQKSMPNAASLRGYNSLRWTDNGLDYFAISDLNAQELAELQRLL